MTYPFHAGGKVVSPERTGWRDAGISAWHRKLGWDCPGADIDALITNEGTVESMTFNEYDRNTPKALIEYKHYNATHNPRASSVVANTKLANMAGLPMFLVYYSEDFTCFTVMAMNEMACEFVPKPIEMSEQEFVQFHYQLRGREATQEFLSQFSKKVA
jgi:hypothetical protein